VEAAADGRGAAGWVAAVYGVAAELGGADRGMAARMRRRRSWEGRTEASGAGWEMDRRLDFFFCCELPETGLGTRVPERMGSSWGI
jgi:hypothetical protein